jgi:alpha-glucosidase
VASPYCIDGWRLDVAADLGHTPEYNHKFWKGFREAVKRENPEAIILAEHYGDPSAWLDGTQWDTVMNYDAFMEPISWFLTGMEKHSDARRSDLRGNAAAFFGSMTDYGARFTTPSALVAMNELSNHDHSRFLTRTNHVVGRTAFAGPQAANYGVNLAVMRQAVLMQMTWVGAPTIYYGDEAGVCGWTDPDNRRSYPWGKEDHELIRFHKEMIRIHKDYEVFSTGSLLYLHAENNLIGYGRFSEKEQAFVLVQVEGEEREVEVDVWRLGVANGSRMACMMYTCEEGFDMAARMCRVENGKVKVEIGKNGAVLWKTLSM